MDTFRHELIFFLPCPWLPRRCRLYNRCRSVELSWTDTSDGEHAEHLSIYISFIVWYLTSVWLYLRSSCKGNDDDTAMSTVATSARDVLYKISSALRFLPAEVIIYWGTDVSEPDRCPMWVQLPPIWKCRLPGTTWWGKVGPVPRGRRADGPMPACLREVCFSLFHISFHDFVHIFTGKSKTW